MVSGEMRVAPRMATAYWEVNVARERQMGGEVGQQRQPLVAVRRRQRDLAVEAARAAYCGIQRIGPIRRSEHLVWYV